MEDLKRLVLPAVVAIILHGVLISIQLPKQQTVKPVLKGAPIAIQINAVPPDNPVLQKVEPKKVEPQKVEPQKVEPVKIEPEGEIIVAETKSLQKIAQENVPKPPVNILRQQNKVIIEPKPVVPEKVVEESNNQESLEEVAVQAVEKKTTAALHVENESEEILPREEVFVAPVRKKAAPVYRQNSQPSYPVMAKRRGYEGEVLLHALIDIGGRVSVLEIKRSSGHISLDRAALKTVKKWLFSPATEGDMSVAMWVDVPIVFQLK